jgi:hypothetical protein
MVYDRAPETSPFDPEAVRRLQAIQFAHNIVQHLDAVQMITRGTRSPRIAKLLLEPRTTEAIPAPYRQFALGPFPGHAPIDGVNTLYVKVPTPYYHSGDIDDAVRPTPQFNDIFLEVVYGSDEPRHDRYFLNAMQPLTAYEDAADFAINPEYEFTRDLFEYIGDPEVMVAPGAEPQPSFTTETFFQLLQDYARLDQNRNRPSQA